MKRLFFIAYVWASASQANAQTAVTGSPPVVFVSGYQLVCLFSSGFAGSFGAASSLLNILGIQSAFYDTCSCSGCSIEEHGKQLGNLIGSLKKSDGTAVDRVDLVAASMGGLIVRSFLSGKSAAPLSFSPPLNPKIRKIIFIATPHFGLTAPAIDQQLSQMQPGSRFLWDLATWNQGSDDLRGADAIAIAGSGGARGKGGLDDGIVPLTSASLSWIAVDSRTRILPYCHTNSIQFIVNCRADAPSIINIDSLNHPTFRIIRSFIFDTDEWKSIGIPPSGNEVLSVNGGVVIAAKDANDKTIFATSVKAAGKVYFTDQLQLQSRTNGVFYQESMRTQPYTFLFHGNGAQVVVDALIPAGGTRALPLKIIPSVARVIPAAASLPHLSLAPGMIVSIFGTEMAPRGQTSISINGITLQTSYVSNEQINSVLPPDISGVAKLTLRNSLGEHTLDILVEPAVPAVFSLSGNGIGTAAATDAITAVVISSSAPASAGQLITLYATGLGAVTRVGSLDLAVVQPGVMVEGKPARILFAGRAPGFPGLDQINFEMPASLPAATMVRLEVRSGYRTSNTVTLAIR